MIHPNPDVSSQNSLAASQSAETRNEAACEHKLRRSGRLLYRPDELPNLLNLSPDQIASLEATGQITPILICGEKRFDSREIAALIQTYLCVAQRRMNNAK